MRDEMRRSREGGSYGRDEEEEGRRENDDDDKGEEGAMGGKAVSK